MLFFLFVWIEGQQAEVGSGSKPNRTEKGDGRGDGGCVAADRRGMQWGKVRNEQELEREGNMKQGNLYCRF